MEKSVFYSSTFVITIHRLPKLITGVRCEESTPWVRQSVGINKFFWHRCKKNVKTTTFAIIYSHRSIIFILLFTNHNLPHDQVMVKIVVLALFIDANHAIASPDLTVTQQC